MKWMKKGAALLLTLGMLLTMPLSASATEGFENNNCLIFATEPGATSPHVMYYKDGAQQSTDAMQWVDDETRGKVLSLDGRSEYLEIGYYQLRMSQMTFSTWINFRGAADETNPAGMYWQRLFTIDSGDQCYFTVSPHAIDHELKAADGEGQLDGVYMEYYRGYSAENGQEYTMKSFSSARPGVSSFGLPQNEWHHMAVVVDNMNVILYVDGTEVLNEVFLMPIVQMAADSMKVGKGFWSDPTLNALLDDTMMFDKALSAEQIAALMQTGDVTALGNAAAITTTASVYQPTAPTTTMTVPGEATDTSDAPFQVFGFVFPLWGYAVVISLLALFIVLTVIVNVYESYWRQKTGQVKPKTKKTSAPIVTVDDDDDEAPAMSIKEAALQKRREERERFLKEEEEEKQKQQTAQADKNDNE